MDFSSFQLLGLKYSFVVAADKVFSLFVGMDH